LNYLLVDHLGSNSLTTNASGQVVSELRYNAWGETRYSSGNTSTKYQYTGQYSYTSDFGLMFYNARWYDPSLSRFTSADILIPGGVQGLDRYAYVQNNPLLYVDPSGHCGIETDKNGKETVGKLDCKAKDISGWSMAYRLSWFKLLTSVAGASVWFHNIEGVIESFDENNLGETASGEGTDDWFSWTDAGLLESIQDGFAGNTEGAAGLWDKFFDAFRDDPDDKASLKQLWGEAEEAGIKYGGGVAAEHGYAVPDDAKDFLFVGNMYRSVTGIPYGGEILGGGFGALIVGATGFRACGPWCAVGGAVIGGAGGGYVGGSLTYPGFDIAGHHPVYYVANALLGSR